MVEGGQVGPERAVQRDGGDGVFLAISQGSGRAIYESSAAAGPRDRHSSRACQDCRPLGFGCA